MKLQEKQKKQKGITLVALVVTIIILIILATISIQMVIGEGGLIWQANNGKVEYRAAEVEEEVLAWKAEKQMAKYTDGITPQERDALIEDQLKRGLLTQEEADTATETGEVKIGSRLINYGDDETSSEPPEELSIRLDQTNVTIGVDNTLTIVATTTPENKEVTWTSSNGSLVSVENNGEITAKLSGTVIITASISDDKGKTKEATCQVEAKSRFSEKYEETKTRDGGTATIPGGYAVGISSDVNDENKGLVITDDIETVGENHYSTGNEFVWVPVDDINKIARCQTHQSSSIIDYDETSKNFTCSGQAGEVVKLEGKLYDFEKDDTKGSISNEKTSYYGINTKKGYREPAYDADYSSDLDKIQKGLTQDVFKTQLQDEFNSMVASVDQYKGFYIGRYETSDLKTETPKVQAEQEPTTNIDWYRIYKNSEEVAKEGSNVTSSMIWGCQWDAVMNWFIDCGGDTAKYVTDSTDKGYYDKKEELITGSNPAYRVNNIYDMAGCVSEWTLECYNVNMRVTRGGYAGLSGSSYPSSYRGGCSPSYYNQTALRFACHTLCKSAH